MFVVTDINVGLLLFMAMSSLGVYAITLGGWASNNKYALLGALRNAHEDITVKEAAAEALGRVRDRKAIPILVEELAVELGGGITVSLGATLNIGATSQSLSNATLTLSGGSVTGTSGTAKSKASCTSGARRSRGSSSPIR